MALAALLVACGNSNPGLVDGGDGGGGGGDGRDSMIDADPNVRGTVTVRMVDSRGGPLPGMHVLFVDTDATVTTLMTDAAGMAQAEVYPNASVTALRARDTGMQYSQTTVLALVPGDNLTLITAAGSVSSTEDTFTQRNVPLPSWSLVASPNGAMKSGSTATFTTTSPHGLAVGDWAIVRDVPVSGYNGTWQVTAITATTFSANLGAGGLADSGSGALGATAAKGERFTISYPAYGGAERYEIYTPCGPVDVGTLTSATLTLRPGCSASSIDIVVVAKTNIGVSLAYTEQSGVAFSAGGNTTITDTWHALAQVSATYNNTTTRVTELELDRFTPYVRGLPGASAMSSTGTGPTTLMVSAPMPARAVMKSFFRCPSGGDCVSNSIGVASQTITEVVDGTAASYSLDVGAMLLPWVAAQYTPTTTTIEVAVVGTGAIDLFEANLKYVRGNSVIYNWRVFGPIAGNVTFPTLPNTLPGDPTVRPTDTQAAYQVFLCESNVIGGYRDAIKNVYEALGTCEASSSLTVKPQGGTLNRLSQWN